MASFSRVLGSSAGRLTVQGTDGQTYTVSGARNLRNNNPGNIEAGSYANSLGAIGSDGRFAVFPDYATGQAAQANLQFNSPSYSGLTIQQAIDRYAPPSENDSAGYAGTIARAVGVPVNTPLASLNPAQQQTYLRAQQNIEGSQPQVLRAADGTVLPPANIPDSSAYADTGAAASAASPEPVSTMAPADAAMQNITNPDGSVNWGDFYRGLLPASTPAPMPVQTPTQPVPLAPDMRQADQMIGSEFASLGLPSSSDAATSLAMNPDLLSFTPNLNTPDIGYTGPQFDAGYVNGQVVPYATANSAANFSSPLTALASTVPPAPTMTTANGDSYTPGKSYTLPDGATFTANPDGSFTKTASTPRSMTPIQLALAAAAPGAMTNLNNEVAGVKNLGSQAGSAVGSFFGKLFSPSSASGGAPPATATSAGSPYDNAALGSLVDSEFASLPSSSSGYTGMDAGTSLALNPALLAGASAPSFTAQPTVNYANGTVAPPVLGGYDPGTTGTAVNPTAAANGAIYTGQGIAGIAQLPAGYTPPAGTVPANSGPDTSWNDLINSFNSGTSSMAMNQPNSAPAVAATAAPTSKTILSQQLNPAYSAWLKDQSSAPYGVEGVDSPSLDASGNVVLPSSYLGASSSAAAPTKYLTVKKVVPVAAQPAQSSVAQTAPPASRGLLGIAAALQPVASTNGYIYQPNGSGGFTNVGTATPNLTPAQQYSAALASMTGLASSGDPNGNVGGISTTGYNLQTGGQGGNNASQNRMQSPGGSLTGV